MKLSIVIPIYNGANWIVRSFSSIAKQKVNEDDYEVVVVNDCSTDGSAIIAERFEEDFKHFKLSSTDHKSGPGGARNLGVRAATGDYIMFLDCDDYLPEDSLKMIMDAIKKSNADVIKFPYLVNRSTDSKRPQGLTFPNKSTKIEDAVFSPVGPWTQVFKRSKYVPMPEGILSEDTAWHYWLYDQFDTVYVIDSKKPCYVYDRTNATAITDTVEWCGNNSLTMEDLAFNDRAIKDGKNDQWISDVIRNFANMYDVRRKLRKPWCKAAWSQRFKTEYQNLMTGHYCH